MVLVTAFLRTYLFKFTIIKSDILLSLEIEFDYKLYLNQALEFDYYSLNFHRSHLHFQDS